VISVFTRPPDVCTAAFAHPHYAMDKVPRHSTEVDYHCFRDELLSELAAATVWAGVSTR
jgi:hypothetical protein